MRLKKRGTYDVRVDYVKLDPIDIARRDVSAKVNGPALTEHLRVPARDVDGRRDAIEAAVARLYQNHRHSAILVLDALIS